MLACPLVPTVDRQPPRAPLPILRSQQGDIFVPLPGDPNLEVSRAEIVARVPSEQGR